MGASVNGTRCKDCEEEFNVVLEWASKQIALDIIKETKCPKCGSENWYFTDEIGQ